MEAPALVNQCLFPLYCAVAAYSVLSIASNVAAIRRALRK